MDRRAIAVSGIVQGVGFRPFVYDLATRLGLNGFVRNETGGVLIEVEGELGFPRSVFRRADVTARRRWRGSTMSAGRCDGPRGDPRFRIETSQSDGASSIFISPDVATCDDCLRELFDPGDRRYRYPFLNCTHCGPRLTIIRAAPYDRERTTMAAFAMCPACRAEYEDPRDRRFHAQPIACPACGPRLRALDSRGQPRSRPTTRWHCGVALLKQGKIVALKGLGGYHLACLAGDGAGRGRAAPAEAPR